MKNFRLAVLLKHVRLILVLSLFTFSQIIVSANAYIIPKPQKIINLPNSFSFDKKTSIIYHDNTLETTAYIIKNDIKDRFGLNLEVLMLPKISNIIENAIFLEKTDKSDYEAYSLKVEPKRITCRASSNVGLFYGIQSLIQAMTQEKNKTIAPCMFIEDKPLFSWRGFMLDESRHFFGKETVKQYLNIMSGLKLNRFHWHLTDESAWRIEIKKYPQLTETGAIGSWDDRNAPRAYYTQEDIKEIVKYAAERNIMIIPEIDMPGHATAASRAYPEISGGGEGRWKGFTFHPAKEITYEFIDNVLTEIAELFPAPYIHIGGDEVHYGNQSWFTDPVIQDFIKKNNLKNESELEHYFVKRACAIVKSKGKRMIGWDEITSTGIQPEDAVVMWWRHDKPETLSKALEKGFEVILTPRIPCYFDFVQDSNHKIGRKWGIDFNEIQIVYEFPTNLNDIVSKYSDRISGMQANVWTERIKDKKRLDFMTFPRLTAISEAAWTLPENKNYFVFESAVEKFLQYLKTLKIYYYNIFDKNSTPEPWGPETMDVIAEG